jgi:hypothetical protein
MSTTTAALLDPDGSGVLKDLPEDCGVYYMGKHVLSGVGEPLDLLLVLPEILRCRLALQQADLRSDAVKVPGILKAPVPSPAASDSTALVFVQFSGLSTLMAWDAEETSRAIRLASACISDVLASCQGTVSEDGLTPLLQAAGAKAAAMRVSTFPDATVKGRVVCAFAADTSGDADSHKPAAVSFALALHTRLLMDDWGDRLLQHELAEPLGTIQTGTVACVGQAADEWSQDGLNPDRSYHKCSSSGLDSTQSTKSYSLSPSHPSMQSRDGIASGPLSGPVSNVVGQSKYSQGPTSFTSVFNPGGHTPQATSILRGASKTTAPGSGNLPQKRGTVSFQTQVESVPASKINTRKPFLQKRASKRHVALDVAGLRGLRFKIVVTLAQQASFSVAKRSSGRVVYSGDTVKKALKELGKARLGQIVVHRELMPATCS